MTLSTALWRPTSSRRGEELLRRGRRPRRRGGLRSGRTWPGRRGASRAAAENFGRNPGVRLTGGNCPRIASIEPLPQSPHEELVRRIRRARSSASPEADAARTMTTLPSSSGERTSRQCSSRTISSGRRTMPSARSQPAASSKSWPGVRIVTASVCAPDPDLQRLLDRDAVLASLGGAVPVSHRRARRGQGPFRENMLGKTARRRGPPSGRPRSTRGGRANLLEFRRSGVHLQNRGSSAGRGGTRSESLWRIR